MQRAKHGPRPLPLVRLARLPKDGVPVQMAPCTDCTVARRDLRQTRMDKIERAEFIAPDGLRGAQRRQPVCLACGKLQHLSMGLGFALHCRRAARFCGAAERVRGRNGGNLLIIIPGVAALRRRLHAVDAEIVNHTPIG